mmetsp:Transcript_2947/g.8717  ORF Transcript_2947/g.8717 Transcript_2947/m.8717 type:complete len:314 (+) Transcript_2947:218-1159(+)
MRWPAGPVARRVVIRREAIVRVRALQVHDGGAVACGGRGAVVEPVGREGPSVADQLRAALVIALPALRRARCGDAAAVHLHLRARFHIPRERHDGGARGVEGGLRGVLPGARRRSEPGEAKVDSGPEAPEIQARGLLVAVAVEEGVPRRARISDESRRSCARDEARQVHSSRAVRGVAGVPCQACGRGRECGMRRVQGGVVGKEAADDGCHVCLGRRCGGGLRAQHLHAIDSAGSAVRRGDGDPHVGHGLWHLCVPGAGRRTGHRRGRRRRDQGVQVCARARRILRFNLHEPRRLGRVLAVLPRGAHALVARD